MVAGQRVRVGAVMVTRIHVNQGRVQSPDPMEELVADLLGDPVALGDGRVAVDRDRQRSLESVSQPEDETHSLTMS